MGEARAGASPQLPQYTSALSGAVAGLVSGIVVCPLDVVKTRLQVQGSFDREQNNMTINSSKSAKSQIFHTPQTFSRSQTTHKFTAQPHRTTGVLSTMRLILIEDGVRGLYSGLVPLCVGYLPSWAIYFYVYKSMQRYMQSDLHPSAIREPYAWLPVIKSAVIAGACSTIATNPIWMIKTRLMAQTRHTSWQYKGMIDAARSIYTHEGIRAFYSGLGSALLGLPHVAIHFPLYERLKRKWAPQKQWYGMFGASIISKIVASSITYPHEVVRSRNQIKTKDNRYRGILNTVRTLWVEEGWRVFYAGLGANVCRAMPSSAVTLLTFELVNNSFIRYYSQQIEFTESDHSSIASSDDPLIHMVVDESDNR